MYRIEPNLARSAVWWILRSGGPARLSEAGILEFLVGWKVPMTIVYHSDCCPLMARELSQLILEAYKLYYGSRKGEKPPGTFTLDEAEYRLHTPLHAKVLPLSRFKIFGFVASRGDCAYVVFRGTEAISEWVGDGRFVQVPFVKGWGKVHKGFKEIYRSCSLELMTALKQLGPEIRQIVIAGHSLGAALGTLACVEILEQTAFENPIHYTFASPRVGNLKFAERFQQTVPQSYRILNTEDIVITEPKAAMIGTLWQYAHVGIPFAFSHHGGSLLENHMLESYINHL